MALLAAARRAGRGRTSMTVPQREIARDPLVGATSCWCARRCASGRSSWASAWSTRPRSSPPRASSRATRSTTAAAARSWCSTCSTTARAGACGSTFEDQGPGIADIELALKDGYTTGGGLGLGLGGAQRLVNEFAIESQPGRARASRSRDGNDRCRRRAPARASRSSTRAESARRGRRRAAAAGRRGLRRGTRPAGWRSSSPRRPPTSSSTRSGGELLVRAARAGRRRLGVEVLALDAGPGMADCRASLRDGYSTAGTPGHRPRRHAPGSPTRSTSTRGRAQGTVAAPRRLAERQRRPPPRSGCESGVVCLPKPGETVCGDAWAVRRGPRRAAWCSWPTGSATGPDAAAARRAARRGIAARAADGAGEIARRGARALRPTRGAAVAVADVDLHAGRACVFAGVGNIAGRDRDGNGASRSLVSHNGTVGHTVPQDPGVHSIPCPAGALLVMHSDGLQHALGPWTATRASRRAIRRSSPRAVPRLPPRPRRRDRARRCATAAAQ